MNRNIINISLGDSIGVRMCESKRSKHKTFLHITGTIYHIEIDKIYHNATSNLVKYTFLVYGNYEGSEEGSQLFYCSTQCIVPRSFRGVGLEKLVVGLTPPRFKSFSNDNTYTENYTNFYDLILNSVDVYVPGWVDFDNTVIFAKGEVLTYDDGDILIDSLKHKKMVLAEKNKNKYFSKDIEYLRDNNHGGFMYEDYKHLKGIELYMLYNRNRLDINI